MAYENDLQRSEATVAIILGFLLGRGIQSGGLFFKELQADEGLRPFFAPCMRWLRGEGLVRYRDEKEYGGEVGIAFFDPCLTSRGFAVMGERLRLGDRDISVGQAVKEVSEDGVSFSRVGDFFGGVLGGFTKSMGS